MKVFGDVWRCLWRYLEKFMEICGYIWRYSLEIYGGTYEIFTDIQYMEIVYLEIIFGYIYGGIWKYL